uniref:Retroviral polymerase SH3-like domain-containing protein n=1 Tax=Chenopodium quinoa TaxID=63459 RepID=A0A803MDF6_CHEQI
MQGGKGQEHAGSSTRREKGWRLYDLDTNEFFISRDVQIFEDKFPYLESLPDKRRLLWEKYLSQPPIWEDDGTTAHPQPTPRDCPAGEAPFSKFLSARREDLRPRDLSSSQPSATDQPAGNPAPAGLISSTTGQLQQHSNVAGQPQQYSSLAGQPALGHPQHNPAQQSGTGGGAVLGRSESSHSLSRGLGLAHDASASSDSVVEHEIVDEDIAIMPLNLRGSSSSSSEELGRGHPNLDLNFNLFFSITTQDYQVST